MAICTGPEAIKIVLNIEHQLEYLTRLQQGIDNNKPENIQAALKEIRSMANEIKLSANEILEAERSANALEMRNRTYPPAN